MTVEIYGTHHQLLYIYFAYNLSLSMHTKTIKLNTPDGELQVIEFKSYMHYPEQNRLIVQC